MAPRLSVAPGVCGGVPSNARTGEGIRQALVDLSLPPVRIPRQPSLRLGQLPKKRVALLDATDAYPKKELKKWRRHIILEKPVITVVVDEVGSSKGAEIEARFHSEAEQQVREGFTLLHGKEGDMALIPVVEGKFAFRPDSHHYLAFQKQASFQRIPYNGTVLHAASGNTIIAHIILPVKDEAEAAQVVKSSRRSGNFTLSCEYRGKKYEYRFRKDAEGLVLEK